MPSRVPSILEDRLGPLRDRGLNLVGYVSSTEFDRCQPKGRRASERLPGCGTIVVLGSGGPTHWNELDEPRDPERLASDTDRELAALTVELTERGRACSVVYPNDARPLSFVALGEMAGLGTVSPVVGLLVHPEYGLWVRLRAAILIAGETFGHDLPKPVSASFQPCAECTRPCVEACPANAYCAIEGADMARCAEHRHRGGCAHHCDARHACPIGGPHCFHHDEERMRHARSLGPMRRFYGLGVWGLVPRALRKPE